VGRSRLWLGTVQATGLGTVRQGLPRLSGWPYGRPQAVDRALHEMNLKTVAANLGSVAAWVAVGPRLSGSRGPARRRRATIDLPW